MHLGGWVDGYAYEGVREVYRCMGESEGGLRDGPDADSARWYDIYLGGLAYEGVGEAG